MTRRARKKKLHETFLRISQFKQEMPRFKLSAKCEPDHNRKNFFSKNLTTIMQKFKCFFLEAAMLRHSNVSLMNHINEMNITQSSVAI